MCLQVQGSSRRLLNSVRCSARDEAPNFPNDLWPGVHKTSNLEIDELSRQ